MRRRRRLLLALRPCPRRRAQARTMSMLIGALAYVAGVAAMTHDTAMAIGTSGIAAWTQSPIMLPAKSIGKIGPPMKPVDMAVAGASSSAKATAKSSQPLRSRHRATRPRSRAHHRTRRAGTQPRPSPSPCRQPSAAAPCGGGVGPRSAHAANIRAQHRDPAPRTPSGTSAARYHQRKSTGRGPTSREREVGDGVEHAGGDRRRDETRQDQPVVVDVFLAPVPASTQCRITAGRRTHRTRRRNR